MDYFIDYGCSFIQTQGPENAVRFLVESRMEILDMKKKSIVFYQAASCKSENTFAKKNLFMEDNYNFIPVFEETNKIIIFRSYVPWREKYVSIDDKNSNTFRVWGKPEFLLKKLEEVTLLENNKMIINATHKGFILIGRTEILDGKTGLKVIIEYPVKTMNTNIEKQAYQVDTGPVLYPLLEERNLSIAYIAFNAEGFCDFVIEQPTRIKDNVVVPHFSGIIKNVRCKNLLYAIKP
ncbi:MAG: hypothetical protein BWX89_00592 [candidate division TA06 bacterium ADurb.Bin131]|jgi:hypothetical protein|uniref:Uncharacterized protein n=1 Tax=candidate division TA06 bacterium ADurb.Bin131 TaxID=1852827 RepID=A0A1V6CBL3_UNCT6|nr:MAG: hypothetical protein BWX89_00592 [candidate division TA06 bacterium ADurb.Bin131]HOC03471.1 hypothetical protein [bacterium]HON05662.1 hypothetical protein [bacterium]HPC29175.1 hypothetical protein [bacterium]HRV04112.1 hypothetical protein [Candidatus Ratteibacteria bacterium]